MSYRVLRRGEARVSDLSAALDELGIHAGDEFVVADPDFRDPDSYPKARTNGRDTSRLAWLANRPRAGTQRAACHEAHLPYVSVSARITELKVGGWVVPEGTRPTSKGVDADVLVPTGKEL